MEAFAVRAIRWVRGLFGPEEPALPPLGADAQEVLDAVAESRQLAEQSRAAVLRVERLAQQQQQHMRYLEQRLRLYSRQDDGGAPEREEEPGHGRNG